MSAETRALILKLLDECDDLTVATIRPDGTPQANIVNFGHEHLTLFFATGRDSQKVRNLQGCNQVSLAMRTDYEDWASVKGLSIAGTATLLADDSAWAQRAKECLSMRFPGRSNSPSPQDLPGAVFVRIMPSEICLIDYSKGYGHREVMRVPEPD